MIDQLLRHRFSIEQYERMVQAGILGLDDRVELLNGEIVEVTPPGPRHCAWVARLQAILHDGATGRFSVRTQCPIALPGSASMPEPDLALVRPRSDFYAAAHPGADDVLLAIEVSESSLATDRSVKAPIYARAGIAEYWVVDVARVCVHLHADPGDGGYARVTRHARGDSIPSVVFPCRVDQLVPGGA